MPNNMCLNSRCGQLRDELDSRLNCFGEFTEGDAICLKSCALNINCAIAKNKFLGFQLLDDSGLPLNHHFDAFEAE
ncbi:MAG: hypothetical protein LBV21_02730 [Candidatus Adiutrix sp.]|nr:hypothetical protein [Candidatus Adiutrix sp.]